MLLDCFRTKFGLFSDCPVFYTCYNVTIEKYILQMQTKTGRERDLRLFLDRTRTKVVLFFDRIFTLYMLECHVLSRNFV